MAICVARSRVTGASLQLSMCPLPRAGPIQEKAMSTFKAVVLVISAVLMVLLGTLGTHESVAVTPESALTLSGDDEVPPVKSGASGSGSITVGADKSVSGSVT